MKILAYIVKSCSFAIEFILTFTVPIKQHLRIKFVTLTEGAEIFADAKSAGYFFFLQVSGLI